MQSCCPFPIRVSSRAPAPHPDQHADHKPRQASPAIAVRTLAVWNPVTLFAHPFRASRSDPEPPAPGFARRAARPSACSENRSDPCPAQAGPSRVARRTIAARPSSHRGPGSGGGNPVRVSHQGSVEPRGRLVRGRVALEFYDPKSLLRFELHEKSHSEPVAFSGTPADDIGNDLPGLIPQICGHLPLGIERTRRTGEPLAGSNIDAPHHSLEVRDPRWGHR